MLLILAQWLQDDFRFFRVFNYITFRAVMATLTALLIGLAAGPWVIRKLSELKMGQAVRSDGPQSHLVKTGTPTMGGVLILIGIFVLFMRVAFIMQLNCLCFSCFDALVGFV